MRRDMVRRHAMHTGRGVLFCLPSFSFFPYPSPLPQDPRRGVSIQPHVRVGEGFAAAGFFRQASGGETRHYLFHLLYVTVLVLALR